MGKKIYISPSSQPANTYAVGATNEQEQCRKIAAALEAELNRCGFTAKAGLSGTMYTRVPESNAFGADLHLPIHTNAFDGKVAGLRIMVYKKGGEAEAIAQAWGNLDFNTVILEQRENESVCLSYCWDVETNTRASRSFIVPHKIATKHGEKVLTDPREIYELAANQGARRLRACILSIIPGDIVDEAIDACNATLSGGNKRPLIDRLRELTDRFMTYHSVTLSSIERYFGYPLDSFTEMDGVTLAGIYTALRDGAASREDYFQMPKLTAGEDDKTSDKTADAPKKAGKKQVKMDDL
jgi:hypothetical protein